MSIFSIEPYENIVKTRKKETIKIAVDFRSYCATASYQKYLEDIKKECDDDFNKITKDFTNVKQTSLCVEVEDDDGCYNILLLIDIERDETKMEYIHRKQYDIAKLKKNMDKEEVRRIEESDRLKREYNQFLALQEKFKNVDPSTLL